MPDVSSEFTNSRFLRKEGRRAFTEDMNYPSVRETPQVRYDFKGEQVQVLGIVSGEGESMNILCLYAKGNNGFKTLMDAVKAKYPDADAVINLHWDTRYTLINLIYLPVYQKVHSTIWGTAIKIKK